MVKDDVLIGLILVGSLVNTGWGAETPANPNNLIGFLDAFKAKPRGVEAPREGVRGPACGYRDRSHGLLGSMSAQACGPH
jgi:hypothetical protein